MVHKQQAENGREWSPGARRPFSGFRALTTGLLFVTLQACGGGSDAGGGFGGNPGSEGSGGSGTAELSLDSISFSPSQAAAGDLIHVMDAVKNSGALGASNFQVGIYLSADGFITTADTLIGSRSIGVLAPNSVSNGSGFMSVPQSTAEGNWYVGALVDPGGAVPEANESNNSMAAQQQLSVSSTPAPDLTPTQVTFDTTVLEAGQSLGVTDTVQNVGVGAAGGFQVGIYLSADSNITATDVLLGLRSVPSLAPSEASFLNSQLTVPANTPAGVWNIGALADVYGAQTESDEFNNALLATGSLTVTQPPLPDLRMVSLDFSPAQLDAGQSMLINESVTNQGLVAAGPFRVGIFLSLDPEITTSDALLGFRALGGLSVGETSPVSAPLVVPATVGTGTFYVGAIADHQGTLIEEDEDNNSILALGTVEIFVPPLPDLAVTAVSFDPTVAQLGASITVVERVVNNGTADAGSFRVSAYLSIDPSVTTSDILLGSRTISALALGAQSDSVNVYPLPNGIGNASYTLGVIADDLQAIQEPNEANNRLIAPGLLDVAGSVEAQADLVVELLTGGPTQIEEGGQLSVQSTIRNEGDLSAGLFKVHFYLSVDDVMEVTDYLVGVRTITGLAIGGGSAQSFFYNLDPAIPLGEYHFGALCDATSLVVESDEGNNSYVIPGMIEVYVPPPPAPDLKINSIAVDKSSLVIETDLQFSHTVRNVGNLDAGASHVDYYMSQDNEITSADILVGTSLPIPGLAIDAESQGAATITLPPEVTVGLWYVGGIVVVDSGPLDSNPANDSAFQAATIEVTF